MIEAKQTTVAPVRVDFYKGADGPTLRIDIADKNHLLTLTRAVNSLWRGRTNDIPLETLFPVSYEGIGAIQLSVCEGTGMMRKSIYQVSMEDGSIGFIWSPTTDGWYQNLGLLGGLLRGTAGHQYFGQDSHDDALIVITLGE